MSSAPLFLALRYLRPTRSFISVITVISMLGVMLGVGVLVFVMSVFSGWQREFRQMLIGFEPHAMVQPMNSRDNPAASQWREVRKALAAHPEVASAVPIAEGVVFVENESSLQGVRVIGMADEADNALLQKLKKHLKEGKFDLKGDSIVLSDKFAREIGAKIGDTLVVHAAESVDQFIQQVREIPEGTEEKKRAEALDNVTVLSKDLTLVATLRADTAGLRGYVPLHIAQEFFNLDSNISGIDALQQHISNKSFKRNFFICVILWITNTSQSHINHTRLQSKARKRQAYFLVGCTAG
jgi:lipoprotein-releasing system permease protein